MLDTHVIEHFPGPEGPPYSHSSRRYNGGRFHWVSNSALRFVIETVSGRADMPVSDGADDQIVYISADLDCDLAISGIGGLHNAFAEAADTPYVIYAAWDPSTEPRDWETYDPADIGLFAVPSGTVVDGALVAALTGGGNYSWWSSPVAACINNTALNIVPWAMCGDGSPYFSIDLGVLIASGLTSIVADTAVDCSAFIPDIPGLRMLFYTIGVNNGAPPLILTISLNDGATIFERLSLSNIGNGAGQDHSKECCWCCPMVGDPTDFFRYHWSGAPTVGMTVRMVSWWI